jgi:hypothetical protein
MVDQVEPNHVELILQQNDVKQVTSASNYSNNNNNIDDVNDENNAERNSNSNNKKTIYAIEKETNDKNISNSGSGFGADAGDADNEPTITESENVEPMSQSDVVEHEPNNNQNNVDDATNTNSSSTKKNKKRRKQHKTERDILYNMADQPITYTKYVGVQGTCILLFI